MSDLIQDALAIISLHTNKDGGYYEESDCECLDMLSDLVHKLEAAERVVEAAKKYVTEIGDRGMNKLENKRDLKEALKEYGKQSTDEAGQRRSRW